MGNHRSNEYIEYDGYVNAPLCSDIATDDEDRGFETCGPCSSGILADQRAVRILIRPGTTTAETLALIDAIRDSIVMHGELEQTERSNVLPFF